MAKNRSTRELKLLLATLDVANLRDRAFKKVEAHVAVT